MPLVKDKVKHLICLGIDNTKLIDSFHNIVGSIEEAGSAEEAVRKAMKAATPGDVVLLHRHVQVSTCSKTLRIGARNLKRLSEN